MLSLLAEYEARLHERENLLNAKESLQTMRDLVSLKFSPNGEIKSYYGLTCIAWADSKSELHQRLCEVQSSIKAKFASSDVDQFFFFLEPSSFHMTICDITARSTPLTISEIENVSTKIKKTFSERENFEVIKAQVRGIGLKSTITALVRFTQDSELQKVLYLESKIKQAAQVNVRNFLGHITLAYCVKFPDTKIEAIQKALTPFQGQTFGAFSISEFDLTYFTNMNTYLPLSTIKFESGQVQNYPSSMKNNTIIEASLP